MTGAELHRTVAEELTSTRSAFERVNEIITELSGVIQERNATSPELIASVSDSMMVALSVVIGRLSLVEREVVALREELETMRREQADGNGEANTDNCQLDATALAVQGSAGNRRRDAGR